MEYTSHDISLLVNRNVCHVLYSIQTICILSFISQFFFTLLIYFQVIDELVFTDIIDIWPSHPFDLSSKGNKTQEMKKKTMDFQLSIENN